MNWRTKRKKVSNDAQTQLGSESAMDSQRKSSRIRNGSSRLESRFPVDGSNSEIGSVASRSSIRLIHEVVNNFDTVKRDLVRSTGFHGILYFPPIKQFNSKFVLWLMSCVDEHTSVLNIRDDLRIKFNKVDVAHVLGIPYSGRSILDFRQSISDVKERVLDSFLPVQFKEHRSIKTVQAIIERKYEYPISKSEADTFRVAFIVFVVSNLLCPSAKYDYASIDYWPAIQDPDCIGHFDWAEFVVVRLFEAVSKLKNDVSKNIKLPQITGCCLFLQVLYLDSINLERFENTHLTLPRIRDFPYEKMCSMIQADKNFSRFIKSDDSIPGEQLRDPPDCIYSWATDRLVGNDSDRGVRWLEIWDCAVAAVNLLNIPFEAAGPLYIAVAEFQEQVNAGIMVDGIQAIKLLNVLVSILVPYTRGLCYNSSYMLESYNHANEAVRSAVNSGMRILSSPVRLKANGNSSPHMSSSSTIGYDTESSVMGAQRSTCGTSQSQPRSQLLVQQEIGDQFQASIRNLVASAMQDKHNRSVEFNVASVMAKFYSTIRSIRPIRDFDLNATCNNGSAPGQPVDYPGASDCASIPTPWELGYKFDFSNEGSFNLFDLVTAATVDFTESSLGIVHPDPKYIQVSIGALREQFMGSCELDPDLFDALTRIISQEDDELFSSYGRNRWRCIFESDFMASILGVAMDIIGENVWLQSAAPTSSQLVANAKMVFFPLLLLYTWVYFAWNIETNVLYVFEPSYSHPVPRNMIELIQRASFHLKHALQSITCGNSKWPTAEVFMAEVRILTIPAPYINRNNRSGVLCQFFIRCFDGCDIRTNLILIDTDRLASQLLRQVVLLKNNSGRLGDPNSVRAQVSHNDGSVSRINL